MDEAETKLSTKLTQLRITAKRTKSILDTDLTEAIERHQAALKIITAEVDELRREIEARKIADKQEAEVIDIWNTNIETEMAKADENVQYLKEWLKNQKVQCETQEREERIKFELKLHETKMKLQAELEAKSVNPPKSTSEDLNLQAKLPKLVITKYNESYADWPRFWGQFSETIDKTSVAPVTKFTYLRELLGDKVKKVVEALPYTPEGYNCAKAILQEKFGKESEIVKAYVREILDLPCIATADTKQIHDFCEKLTYNVQSLQTHNKLNQVDGAVALVLDKLPSIRGDLVRTDVNWEKWNFVQFSEALRLWTQRNPVDSLNTEDKTRRRQRAGQIYNTQQRDHTKPHACVYCDSHDHKPSVCTEVKTPIDRRKILSQKKLFQLHRRITSFR